MVRQCGPARSFRDTSVAQRQTSSMQFVTGQVGAGVHDVRVQYGGSLATFTVEGRTLTALRAQVPQK